MDGLMRKKIHIPLLLCAMTVFCVLFHGTMSNGAESQMNLPEQARKIDLPGTENFYQVTDRIYRSAQPSARAMREYERFGIKTVISLRYFHDDVDEAEHTALKLIEVPINTWNIDDRDVISVLRLLRDSEGPLLLHCQHGADRTGLMIAMYRIVFQGWSKEQALYELREGGFGFHSIWMNIPNYIERVDVEKIKLALVKTYEK